MIPQDLAEMSRRLREEYDLHTCGYDPVHAGERGELPSGEPEVASPVEQRSTATA